MYVLMFLVGLIGFLFFLIKFLISAIKKNPNKKFALGWIICFVLFVVGISMMPSSSNSNTNEPDKEIVETSPTPEATPDIELSNDYEKAVWQVALDNDGKLISVIDEDDAIYFDIRCENNEKVVNKILDEIAAALKENTVEKLTTITVKDIDKKDSTQNLVIADIAADGTIDIAFTSGDYKSKYNTWLSEQFSSFDGSHYVLESLIEDNLHNEKSYEHIETTYRIVSNEEVKAEINKILSDAEYSNRVEVNDLFIVTTFSAENAFGATVKNHAYGIASYSKDTVTLVAIELA